MSANEVASHYAAVAKRHASEGLVVRVWQDSLSWLGNFQRGDGAMDGLTATPSPQHLCVVAGGRGYYVPAGTPELFEAVPTYPVIQIAAVDQPALLVMADYTRVAAYDRDGLRWVSRAVSWDGIKILRADAEMISGLAWDAPEGEEIEFSIEPTTGHVRSGPEHPPPASLRIL